MGAYVIKRLALLLPTLLGILLINFLIVQLAPGGPVEQIIAQLTGGATAATNQFSSAGDLGAEAVPTDAASSSRYPGSRGLDPEFIAELETQFGFDEPMHVRFLTMVGNYATFDLETSYFQDKSVSELVLDRLPVSISLGLWSTLFVYLISIPLGVAKAVRLGTTFDVWTSAAIFVGYAIPGFLFGVLLVVLFAGGNFWDLFPLRGLQSETYAAMTFGGCLADWGCIRDYFWHITLPVTAMTIGGFATLTMLTKNSFLEEISKQYVITARAKGCTKRQVLYGHVFRNAMLIIIAGFPGAFIGILFTGSLLIEVIFSLDGLGLLSYEAIMKRDYPVIFGSLFFFTLLGLALNLVGDLIYVAVDPRIDFEGRDR